MHDMETSAFGLASVCDLVESQIPDTEPRSDDLLPTGTRLRSTMSGRSTGVIIGYNSSTGPFYGADRYPYIVRWEDGYVGCYHVTEYGISVV